MFHRAHNFIPPDPHVPQLFFTGKKQRFVEGAEVQHSIDVVTTRLAMAIDVVTNRIRVDPSSRVERWRISLERFAEAEGRHVLEQVVLSIQRGSWIHPFRDSFIALGEARVFVEIIEQLVDHLTDRDLRELVSGHRDPSRDKSSARGRDKEFEWFIAALFRKAALAVALEEPDVLIKYGGGIRSIAAKRVNSRRKVLPNIKKAARQIAAEGYPGYIFLDLTRFLDQRAVHICHWRDRSDPVQTALNRFAREPAVTRPNNTLVQGVFLHVSYPLISPGFTFGTFETWMGVAVQGGDHSEHMDLARTLLDGARNV